MAIFYRVAGISTKNEKEAPMNTPNESDTKTDLNRVLEKKEFIYESNRITVKTKSR